MGNLFMWISVILLFLGLPASIIVTIIAFIKKNTNSLFKFSVPMVIGAILFFTVFGSILLPDSEIETQVAEKTEKEETSESDTESEQESKKETKKPEKTKTEDNKKEENKEEPKVELTEAEYKSNCKEVYNADVFKNTIPVGQFVKVRVMASEKYKYGITDMWGIITEDITEKYSLERNSLGCTVMHESTKNDAVPSYFGEQIYVMFQEGGVLNLDTFKTGQKFTLYGEVIQNKNGTFILPKYYE